MTVTPRIVASPCERCHTTWLAMGALRTIINLSNDRNRLAPAEVQLWHKGQLIAAQRDPEAQTPDVMAFDVDEVEPSDVEIALHGRHAHEEKMRQLLSQLSVAAEPLMFPRPRLKRLRDAYLAHQRIRPILKLN